MVMDLKIVMDLKFYERGEGVGGGGVLVYLGLNTSLHAMKFYRKVVLLLRGDFLYYRNLAFHSRSWTNK